ncbi:hypothetical protein COC69_30945 [Bacillus cereus]|uniref:Uncharacterized protein n=1 Tax=Bacillus cereus TaxID=1396 RepID=A0A9X7GST5_BACCE|nr:hypothetical protein [Bacillus cereus]PGS64010.1 hypothetical protein COC69_30945 [Bacillus cereus]
MKYKNQLNTKRKYKQALLATVTTMTLGTSALGGAISAFAAENPQPLKASQSTAFKSNMNFDELKEWVINSRLGGTTYAQISELTPTGTKQISVDEFYLNNDSNQDRLMPVPEKTFTTFDGITTSKSAEFSTSTEVGFENSGITGLAGKITGKFQFGAKTSTGENKTHSDTISVKYGGGTQMVPAGKSVIVQYLYEQQTYNGNLKFGRSIKHENVQSLWHYDLYSNGKFGGGIYDNENYLYDVFNTAINGKTISAQPLPVDEIVVYFNNGDSYDLTKKDVQDHVVLDVDKKQAYLKNDEGSFDGVTGTRIIQQVKDAQTGQVYNSKVVKTF